MSGWRLVESPASSMEVLPMKLKLVTAALLVLLWAPATLAQDSYPRPRIISVTGTAEVTVALTRQFCAWVWSRATKNWRRQNHITMSAHQEPDDSDPR